jgi:bacteriocin-like protein
MEKTMSKTTTRNSEASPEVRERELNEDELALVSGGKRADGTVGGNVAGGWDLVSNKVNA